MLKPGLYEQVINREVAGELSEIEVARKSINEIDKGEASKVLSRYLSEVIQQGLDNVIDNGGDLSSQVSLANQIISLVGDKTGENYYSDLEVDESAKQLWALLSENDPMLALGQSADKIGRPETSLAQSSLFTGSVHEPQMYSELKREIRNTDRIDMLVSFIKWSGLRLIINELQDFTQNGGILRVITTSYMGATDLKAIEELNKLENTKILISYDTERTRLHAKAYVFYRNTGFTTAYIGSSNLSNAAISSGLEWNVKVTAKDLPETIAKIMATFDSYWNSSDFEFYDTGQRERLAKALDAERYHDETDDLQYFFDLHPYSYQQEILDHLTAEREIRGRYRNLVVAATGTGKTIISAFDYRRFIRSRVGSKNRLLFVAHRVEILKQSLDTFRGVLRDPNFGELYVGSYHPDCLDHLFVSIQTLNSQRIYEKLAPDYFDYIIVDEFHHAAASSYQKILDHFEPRILLGLTATPERMDGKYILDWFEGRIAAEIRLPEAIDRKLLCPFQYFGVSDNVDLDGMKWSRGGYDKNALTEVYVLNREVAARRADLVIDAVYRYVTDINFVKGLGFCVSVEHAKFMAECFNSRGISSICLTGSSADELRISAKEKLISGDYKFIFVVDLYNEGVDIPEINTVLFLRPTESLTIFLQQLGRGLRLAEGKDCLTVLDFIGQANSKYNFEEKFAALLSSSHHSVKHEIEHGFVNAPKGCYIQLEKKASKVILDNIKAHFSGRRPLMNQLMDFEDDSGLPLTFENFLNWHHLEPAAIYKVGSFSRLCVESGVRNDFQEPAEEVLTGAFKRLVSVDSHRWIEFLLDILPDLAEVDFSALSENNKRMLQMFYVTVWNKAADDWDSDEVLGNLYDLADSPVMVNELCNLLMYNYEHIDFIDSETELGYDCPLDVHCTYSQKQLLAALDYYSFGAMRQGVLWLPKKETDIFLVTLNKTDKDYSPTTLYNDYSINEEYFHWQSQSTTSDTSPTGQRYIHHKDNGSKVLIFVREYKKNEFNEAAPYTFLGEVEYESYNGSRPMNIIWHMKKPIPAKYLKKTNKLVVS